MDVEMVLPSRILVRIFSATRKFVSRKRICKVSGFVDISQVRLCLSCIPPNDPVFLDPKLRKTSQNEDHDS